MRVEVALVQVVEVADLPPELAELPTNDVRRMGWVWQRVADHLGPAAGRVVSWVEVP